MKTDTTTMQQRVRRSRPRVLADAFLIAFLAVVTMGCGPQKYPVNGIVTFDGKPVQEGTISLEPDDGQGPTTGGKIFDGKYELIGNAASFPGKKKVRIVAARKTGRKIPMQFAEPGTMIDEIVRYIPDIYNTKTTLTGEIVADGPNQINFDLKSEEK